MSLATVRAYVWKKPEDLVLNYRVVQGKWPQMVSEEGECFLLSMAFMILSYHFSTQILLQFCTSENTWKNGLFYLKQKKCKVILPICLWIPFDKSSFGIAQNGYFFPLRGKHNCMENLLILTMLRWFSSGIVFCVFLCRLLLSTVAG